MRTGIEQARIDLAKWEKRVEEDNAALETSMRQTVEARDRLARSIKTAGTLRHVVQQWDAMNLNVTPAAPQSGSQSG